jgi:hypothetical protein
LEYWAVFDGIAGWGWAISLSWVTLNYLFHYLTFARLNNNLIDILYKYLNDHDVQQFYNRNIFG